MSEQQDRVRTFFEAELPSMPESVTTMIFTGFDDGSVVFAVRGPPEVTTLALSEPFKERLAEAIKERREAH